MTSPADGSPRLVGGIEDRFPGYDVLEQAATWDTVTVGVVLRRVMPPPRLRFFTVSEAGIAGPLLDRLLAQDEEPRIPVLGMIDARLVDDQTDGWHYADLPPDPAAWRASLAALGTDADAVGAPFDALDRGAQNALLETIRTTPGDWHGLRAALVWSLRMRYACTAYYSHPWAWNEIGFGGPAYPRGYKNAGVGKLEPWEVAEHHPTDPVPWAARLEAARGRHR